MIIGRDLINEYYEDERLYSTGDDYLDDLLERAFCEGYEYAQYEFADKEDDENSDEDEDNKKKKSGLGKKIAKGVGIGTGSALALAGAYQLARAGQKGYDDKMFLKGNAGNGSRRAFRASKRKLERKDLGLDRFGRKIDDKLTSAGKWVGSKASEAGKKVGGWFKREKK